LMAALFVVTDLRLRIRCYRVATPIIFER
jgi:hypothetical protein